MKAKEKLFFIVMTSHVRPVGYIDRISCAESQMNKRGSTIEYGLKCITKSKGGRDPLELQLTPPSFLRGRQHAPRAAEFQWGPKKVIGLPLSNYNPTKESIINN